MGVIQERIKKNGKVSYRAMIRIKGCKTITATFARKTDAKAWIQQHEPEIKRTKHVKDYNASKYTLTQIIDKYIEEELPKRKSDQKKFKMQLEWWKNEIGYMLLSNVTPKVLNQCKNKLRTEPSKKPKKGNETRSAATVNRYLACLSIVLSIATKEWEIIDENPLHKIKRETEPRGRVRYLNKDENEKLLTECKKISNELYLFVLIAITSGARYSEILNLQWKNIDFTNKQYHFINTKNGEDRGVPIVSVAFKELKNFSKVRRLKTDYLFADDTGKLIYFRNQFYKAVEATGINDFHFHDLRHTAASYLAINGATILDIATILGHKTLAMVKRYSHLTQQHTADIMEASIQNEIGNINKT